MGSALGSLAAASSVGLFGVERMLVPRARSRREKVSPTTSEIREYLLQNSPWVKANNTVDTVKCGDPERPVKKAGWPGFRRSGTSGRRSAPAVTC